MQAEQPFTGAVIGILCLRDVEPCKREIFRKPRPYRFGDVRAKLTAMSFISRFCCMISPRGDPKTIRLPVRALRGGLGLDWVLQQLKHG